MKDEMKSGYENLTNKQETMISTSESRKTLRSEELCSCQSWDKRLIREAGKTAKKESAEAGGKKPACADKYITREKRIYSHCGDDSGEDPPVLIPNTEVKLSCAEST